MLKKIFLVIFICFIAPICYASDLPEPVLKRLKKEFPGVTVRFDAMVELPDRTQYLPVFPLSLKEVKGYAQVVKTYPARKTLRDKPSMILFNNNFALLKVIKSSKDNPTVIYYDDMPLCVKLGLLPQDLLVPENLELPEGLEVLLGNLRIPIKKSDDEFAQFEDFDRYFDAKKARQIAIKNRKKKAIEKKASIFTYKAPELKNKIFYVVSFDSTSLIAVNPETGRVEYKIPVPSIPSDIVQSMDQRYIVVATLGTDKLYIIDLLENKVIKEVETGKLPSCMIKDKTRNVAYIANQRSSSITIFDLHHMDVIDQIKVIGNPCKLTLSLDRKSLIYVDSLTDNVHMVVLGNDEEFRKKEFLMNAKNVSKAVKVQNNLYVVYRNQDYMEVFDIENKQSVEKIYVGHKPVDIKIMGSKAYVLNAGSDSLSVIDLNVYANIQQIPLKTDAFPIQMQILGSQTRAIITTSAGNEFILFDLLKDKIIERYPIETKVHKMVVTRKYIK